MPVADQHPARVVDSRIQPGGDRRHALCGILLRREGQWQLAATSLRGVTPGGRRLIGQARHQAVFVDGEPGAASHLVSAAQYAGVGRL